MIGGQVFDRLAAIDHTVRSAMASRRPTLSWSETRRFSYAAVASSLLSAVIASSTAQAQNGILAPGDAVVSGFSGIRQQPTSASGGHPLDRFFIDLDGPSAQILPLKSLGGAPVGQLAAASPTLTIKASDVGQVFAVALDDGLGQPTPNIYLGASSVFGIHIVKADPATGALKRIRRGEPGAQFMPGQFGSGSPNNAGAIWRVDGATGEVSLFATVPNNSGPGIGDIVFAPHAKQFYVSDLETGRIYRLGSTGEVVDHYDHGVQGRPKNSLPPLADDGRAMSITSPRFNSLRPETWGYTQKSRRVWGMAIRERSLYYAVADGGQIWSVGLAEDGAFADDIRWEMDAAQALKGSGPVTDLAFDKSGNLYVAQRGQQRASYRYAEFVAPGGASVVSFEPRESTDAAAAIGLLQLRDRIPVGVTSQESAGGLALGYGYDQDGTPKLDACDSTVWVTGDRLRSSRDATAAGAGPAADVHGLQGLDVSAAVDSGQALSSAYFLDYDGFFGDPGKAGHIGDVAIWQPCDGAVISSAGPSELPRAIFRPESRQLIYPPKFPPPPQPYSANLALTKRALPSSCFAFAAGWACKFEMQVRNTGKDTFAGPVLISEDLTGRAGRCLGRICTVIAMAMLE